MKSPEERFPALLDFFHTSPSKISVYTMLINRSIAITSLFKSKSLTAVMVYLFVQLNYNNSDMTLTVNPFKWIMSSCFSCEHLLAINGSYLFLESTELSFKQ